LLIENKDFVVAVFLPQVTQIYNCRRRLTRQAILSTLQLLPAPNTIHQTYTFSIAGIVVKLKVKNSGALNRSPISQLRSATCHMGSHSVTCQPTQVNTPRLNPSQTCWYSIYLPQRDSRLSCSSSSCSSSSSSD